MPVSNVTSVIDYDEIYLQVRIEGGIVYVKKVYVELSINAEDPDIVNFQWHWYEQNEGLRLYYLDYNRITNPVTASAAALLAAIDAMLTSQYATSGDDNYWKHCMLMGG